jgi:hypothetical protein
VRIRADQITLKYVKKYVPQEIATKGTKGRLAEEFGNEFVTLDLVDFVMFDGSATARDPATAQTEVVAVQHGTLIHEIAFIRHFHIRTLQSS